MIKKTVKRIVIVILIIAAGAAAAYFTLGKKSQVDYTTAKVERGNIIQTVSETGAVKAASEINLNFLNMGKIAKIPVKVGDAVKEGQILAELDYSGLLIKQHEALANLEIAKANLAKLLAGASKEEIAVAQAGVNQSEAAYKSALSELEKAKKTAAENIAQTEKTLNDLEATDAGSVTTYEQAMATAQTDLDNAKSTYQRSINNKRDVILTTIDNKLTVVKTSLDAINGVIASNDAKSVLSVKDTSYLENTKSYYSQAVDLSALAGAGYSAALANPADSNLSKAVSDSFAVINMAFTALNNCYTVLENTITSSDLSQTELDALKTSISTNLTNISAAISALQTAEQNYEDAKLSYSTNAASAEKNLAQAKTNYDNAVIQAQNALNSAKISGEQQITLTETKVSSSWQSWQVAISELAKIKAPVRTQDAQLYQSQVKQAQAAADSVNNQIGNSIITAPINGIVTKVNYEAGEQSMAAEAVVYMLAENNYEIEVDVSEADIAKVKLNLPAEITLDAFGESVKFYGSVHFIEPAETVIQDVIYYKVKINFNRDKSDLANIRPGMTANIIITTAKKDNILMMPSRAVIEKNGNGKIVRILTNGQVNEAPVQLGLSGDEGMVEVLSGAKEGDDVVTFIKESN